jgi:hypothetical protein
MSRELDPVGGHRVVKQEEIPDATRPHRAEERDPKGQRSTANRRQAGRDWAASVGLLIEGFLVRVQMGEQQIVQRCTILDRRTT